ncbi:MAG: CAP domain-containing protein, partial [Betaproteobacteria bacterium]|nr:CAP domain-containing protein [Betaproteobacteria bacterium]
RRTQIGLSPLTLNAELQTAARGHADYIAINNLGGGHYQDAAQYPSGFTGTTPSDRIASAGYKEVKNADGSWSLATGEVVSRGSFHGEQAVDALIAAIYHRMDIFASNFDEQGAGVAQGAQGITVINFGARHFPPPAAPDGWVGVYPYDGQSGVPIDFYSAEESPRPLAGLGLDRVGYPVSIQIDGTKVLSVSSFALAPLGGSPMQVHLLSAASGDAYMPASAAAIIPLNLLAYGTTYEANFAGTADGVAFAKTWRFTTAPFSAVAITGPATAYVGDTVALKFSGGNGRYSVQYSFTMPQPFSDQGFVGSNGIKFRADATGIVNITVSDADGAKVTLPLSIKSAAEKLLPFAGGWNLVGNGTSAALDVATLFGDAAKVTTVWKWVAASARWAFYAPSLAGQALADYAASKGYDVLSTIAAGEGFWVNAKEVFSAPLPPGTPVFSESLRTGLGTGWNLLAVGDNRTPRGFNDAIGPKPEAGEIPLNLTTLWAWDAGEANWYFYAPGLEKSGGLAAYIASKNYLGFGAKTLEPVMGFWVNKP